MPRIEKLFLKLPARCRSKEVALQLGTMNDMTRRLFEEDLEKVTKDDVQRVAKKYLAETNRTVGWFVPTNMGGGMMAKGNGRGTVKKAKSSKSKAKSVKAKKKSAGRKR